MSSNGPRRRRGTDLGRCPRCESFIHTRRLLIRYETADGWPRTFAECPDREDVVHPA